jgi:hypothetical protein
MNSHPAHSRITLMIIAIADQIYGRKSVIKERDFSRSCCRVHVNAIHFAVMIEEVHFYRTRRKEWKPLIIAATKRFHCAIATACIN